MHANWLAEREEESVIPVHCGVGVKEPLIQAVVPCELGSYPGLQIMLYVPFSMYRSTIVPSRKLSLPCNFPFTIHSGISMRMKSIHLFRTIKIAAFYYSSLDNSSSKIVPYQSVIHLDLYISVCPPLTAPHRPSQSFIAPHRPPPPLTSVSFILPKPWTGC